LATDEEWEQYDPGAPNDQDINPNACWTLGECAIPAERAAAYAGLEAAVRAYVGQFEGDSARIVAPALLAALAALDATAEGRDG